MISSVKKAKKEGGENRRKRREREEKKGEAYLTTSARPSSFTSERAPVGTNTVCKYRDPTTDVDDFCEKEKIIIKIFNPVYLPEGLYRGGEKRKRGVCVYPFLFFFCTILRADRVIKTLNCSILSPFSSSCGPLFFPPILT